MKMYMKILLRNLSHPTVIRYMYKRRKNHLSAIVARMCGFVIWLSLPSYSLWQHGLSSFHGGDTNLEKVFSRDHHTQRKLLNFENWISMGLRSFKKSES